MKSRSRSPLYYRWNTRDYSAGSHTIKAVATDKEGNSASVSIGLTVPASKKKRR